MGERPSETPCWGHKDDSRGHSNYRIVQEGPKDLPQDGPECPVNGLCTQDNTEGSPIIGFLEDDARRLHHPHDNALVVMGRRLQCAPNAGRQRQLSKHPILPSVPADGN